MFGFLGTIGIGKAIAGTVGVTAVLASIATCSKNMSGENDKKYYRKKIGKLEKENKSLTTKFYEMKIKIIKKQVAMGEEEMATIKSEWKKLNRKRKLRCEQECK